MARGLLIAAAIAAAACTAPAIPDGVFACEVAADCPVGTWHCVRGTCERTVDFGWDAGVIERCECEADQICAGLDGPCLHACSAAPSDCPLGTYCEWAGCVATACPASTCPPGDGCRASSGICAPECSAGACVPGMACVDGLCAPWLDQRPRVGGIAEVDEIRCPLGVNGRFERSSLDGWCWAWLEPGPAPALPRLEPTDAAPLRLVLMGRPPRPAPLEGPPAVFSLAQARAIDAPADLAADLTWDFDASVGGPGAGVTLGLVFRSASGRPLIYQRTWNDAREAPPAALFETPPLIEEERALGEGTAPIALDAVFDALAAAASVDPATRYSTLQVGLTVWSQGPRVELLHHDLRVVPRGSP